MTSWLRRIRLVVVIACIMTAQVVTAPAANAADPVTVGLSEVKADATGVVGVLTLRSKSAAQVEPASLRASIDGEPVQAIVKQTPKLERRAMLVIDTSGSMGSTGMATVRTATAEYLQNVPADVRVGVTTFATTAGVDLAPTLDRAAVQRVVNGLAARGDTSLYAGMRSAITSLGPKGDRSIVLLSDGADTIADNRSAARTQVTNLLKSAGVRTDVVQFKTDDPDAVAAIKGFAAANGGSVVAADDTAAVTAAFRDSARALDAQVQFSMATAEPLTGPHEVELSGRAGPTAFSFTRTVNFADAATVPTPSASVPQSTAPAQALGSFVLPAPKVEPWLVWVAAALIGLGLFLLVGVVLAPSLQTRRERRVAGIEAYVVGPRTRSRSEQKAQQTAVTEQLVAFGDTMMKGRRGTAKTMALIDRADLPFRAGEWFLVVALACLAGAFFGFVLMRDARAVGLLLGVVGGGLLGFALPSFVLRHLASRRAAAFERILPDVLMLVATSLRSGFGLPQALDAVARDAAEPAAKEFSRALAETRIGTDVSDALDHMATRMDSKAMRWAVMAIRIQREVGGNLADTLTTTAATLRERESIQRQVRSLSAEGRLSAQILIILPFGMFLYMLMVNYDYISLLWTTGLGIAMIIGGLCLMVVGVVWMRRVVRIEV
ncbi:type II secretion system F family protein [Humibacillus xanthopallidus]|uniref:type II secretion system F family protein n=1 Tax=Humibacillus xanthopallidus TaxID=412689 RepID=UPI00384DE3CF